MACAVEGHKNGVQPLLAHLLSESRIQVVGAKGHQINYQVTDKILPHPRGNFRFHSVSANKHQ